MSKLADIFYKPINGEWGDEDNQGIGFPVLRTTNFTNEGGIDYSNVVTRQIKSKYIKDKILTAGDIIIEKSGGSPNQPVGRVVFFEGEENKYLFNNFTSVLRLKDKIKNYPKYVFYFLMANYKNGKTIKFQNKTTGISNLKLDKYINETEIRLPSLEIQKQIAKTLDTISEMLSLRKQQLAELNNLTKSIFYDMFGDPIINRKGWTIKTVENVCRKIMGGGTPPKNNKHYFSGNIPWVTPKDMKDIFIDDSIDHITEDAVANSSAKIIPRKSVLMVIRSGILKRLLPVAINTVDVTINQDMKAFIPSDEVTAEYLLYYFIAAQNILLKNVRSVTADNIEFNYIKKLNIPCPPIGLQQEFSIIVTTIEDQKNLVKRSIKETQLLFDSLMSQYFDE